MSDVLRYRRLGVQESWCLGIEAFNSHGILGYVGSSFVGY